MAYQGRIATIAGGIGITVSQTRVEEILMESL